MPDIVVSDQTEQTRANDFQTNVLNAVGSYIRLFTAPTTIDPSLSAGSFTQASYAGYVALSIAGHWSTPVQIVPGQWATTMDIMAFPAISGGPAQTIYGMYLTDPAGNLVFSFLFASPVVTTPLVPILCQCTYNFWARILLP